VVDIDFTGAELLRERIEMLRGSGITVALARLESVRAIRAARRTGLIESLGPDHVFRSVEEAVRALGPQ
jgi:SulP family sulfate permease